MCGLVDFLWNVLFDDLALDVNGFGLGAGGCVGVVYMGGD